MKPIVSALLGLFFTSLASAQNPADIAGYAPVSVSSANYRETAREDLLRAVNGRNAINPAARPLDPLATPKHYVFVPGETFSADLNYDAVCAALTESLAKKNYINAADTKGIIREPGKITLILRVSYGITTWRLPVVRTNHIEWSEGLVGKVHDPRSLTWSGGDRVWDSRAGGQDSALNASATNESSAQAFWGGSGSSSTVSPAENIPGTSSQIAYEGTRDFNLVVIDAFDYAEIKAKGPKTKCLWTTFVAAPVQRGQKYSDVLATLLRAATPFWGETSSGMQVYNDARAEVKLADPVVVEQDVPLKK